jgi:integral membrane protein
VTDHDSPETPGPAADADQGGITDPATAQRGVRDPDAAARALVFFRVMAFIVGIGLLLLVAEVILKYGFDNGALDWWPQPHGFVYLVYIGATANLGFKVGWSLTRMVLVMLAGVVPFLSFWAEHRVAREVRARLTARR